MQVTRWATGAEFLARAEAFLAAREVENCLPLGLANQLRVYPQHVTLPPYLATVEGEGQVLAAAVMTPPMRLVLAAGASREALQALAGDLAGFAHLPPGVGGPVPMSEWFAQAWRDLTGSAFQQSMAERIYQLARVTHPAGVAGAARRAVASDRDLLIEWETAFELEAFGRHGADVPSRIDNALSMSTRGLFLWESGNPVSMAGFGGFTPHGVRIGPVYTPPELRGRGYASALTAWLSQHLLDSGRQFCCLYTDLANPTSNHIYPALGYAPVCDVAEYIFTPAVA